MLSSAGIGVMLFVMLMEFGAVFYGVQWYYAEGSSIDLPTQFDTEPVDVELPTIQTHVQTSQGGRRSISTKIVLRLNPALNDVERARTALANDQNKVINIVLNVIGAMGPALFNDPHIYDRLGSRIREELNRAFPIDVAGQGIVTEVFFTQR